MKQSNRNRPMGHYNNRFNNRHNNLSITKNTIFDSSSVAGRVRGNSQQLVDRYLSLAKDAKNQDDRVMYETYSQYADHYTRLLNLALQSEVANQRPVVESSPTPQEEKDEIALQVHQEVQESSAEITQNTTQKNEQKPGELEMKSSLEKYATEEVHLAEKRKVSRHRISTKKIPVVEVSSSIVSATQKEFVSQSAGDDSQIQGKENLQIRKEDNFQTQEAKSLQTQGADESQ